jgi:hypothetical protein
LTGWVAALLLTAALVFTAVMAVIGWRRADSLNNDVTARDNVAAVAGAEGKALFTYDYRDLAEAQQRILAHAGGRFAQQQRAHTASVEADLTQVKATGTAAVVDVSVSGLGRGRAEAFVILHTHVQATGGSSDGTQYLNTTLTQQGGRWKVDAVQTLTPPPG